MPPLRDDEGGKNVMLVGYRDLADCKEHEEPRADDRNSVMGTPSTVSGQAGRPFQELMARHELGSGGSDRNGS
jgi:hypothetical protein